MKALSLRQPWLFAILQLGSVVKRMDGAFPPKRIENRRWNTNFRGPFWLHAAKGVTRPECEDALLWMKDAGVIETCPPKGEWPGFKELQRGGIAGYAELVDVIPPLRLWRGAWKQPDDAQGRLEFEDEATIHQEAIDALARRGTKLTLADLRWWMPDQYGFVLRNVGQTHFIPLKGALGFFDVPDPITEALQRRRRGICVCESSIENIGPGHLPTCRFSDPNYGAEELP